MLELLFDPATWIVGATTAAAAVAAFLGRRILGWAASLLGLDKLEKAAREFVEVWILRKPRYSKWTLTPAEDDEVDYIRDQLNAYLAPAERHQDNSSIARIRAIRSDDYLILRGPVDVGGEENRHGVAIIHPLLSRYGRQFESGAKTGADLKDFMISRADRAKYVYISFAKADDGNEEILAEKIAQNIVDRADGRLCVIARPTTDKALKILTKRGFKRCRPRGGEIEVRQTCFKWLGEEITA